MADQDIIKATLREFVPSTEKMHTNLPTADCLDLGDLVVWFYRDYESGPDRRHLNCCAHCLANAELVVAALTTGEDRSQEANLGTISFEDLVPTEDELKAGMPTADCLNGTHLVTWCYRTYESDSDRLHVDGCPYCRANLELYLAALVYLDDTRSSPNPVLPS